MDDSLWSLCPVQDIDTVLTNRYSGDANDTISVLYCGLYLRQFKESLKQIMLDQESVFEDQIHELHRLYRKQKDLMMEMGETNNLCSQPRHLLLNAGDSSPRAGIHWMSSSISTSKTRVLPPKEDGSAKIDEAGISGDESDKYREKVLDLELPSYGYLDIGEEEEGSKNGEVHESVFQLENVRHLTGFSRSKCILDLNEPAKIEEHSDYEPNHFLSPVQTRSERAESEAQDRPISTKSQVENGINLNMSPLSSEEVTTFKKIESEQLREFLAVSSHGKHITGPSRSIVLALPCSKGISLFNKRSSWPRKKGKRGAKSTTLETFPRRKAWKGSNVDSSVGVNEDDNHSLSTASYIPESDHNQEHLEKGSKKSSLPEVKSARNWTNTRKRRHCKQPHIESGKVMRKNARTKLKTRGSFLVTEKEDEKSSAAAEAVVDMSLSDSAGKSSIETSDCINPLLWFAKFASSVVEDTRSEFGLSVTGFHSDYYQTDYFEAMTLQLTEMKPEEQRTHTLVSNIVSAKQNRTRRSQGKRQQQQHEDHHEENLPSLSTFTGNEASQDVQKIERLIEASETNDAHSSLMENTVIIDWGTIRKRRRGIRIPATKTKNSIAFLQLPF
ncbi:unnamed protein product [Arabis nemorensis]|uniref:Uncharacterized protein n=1 Tax=Arabis nemorensis TaxID=586526 RepID=A0A565CVL3_9BRAS|nr:unnamed protein product [Arabis nemorensis]